MRRITLSEAGTLVAGASGAALFATSFLRGWVDAERHIVGYGQARVVSQQNAWAGFFEPWLPLIGILGLAGAVTAVAGWRSRRPVGALLAVLGLAALGAIAVVMTSAPDNVDPNHATDWMGTPGALSWLGVALTSLLSVGGLLSTVSPTTRRTPVLGTGVVVLALLAACANDAVPSPTEAEAVAPDWRTDANEPYPFTTPIPPLLATALDGVYSRDPTDRYSGPRAACRRCPPYPVDRGTSTLTLALGRYAVVHEEPRYVGIGHFVVEGDTLILTNDPECGETRGTYRWERDGAQLQLDVIDDPCAFGQRAADLTGRIWTLTETSRGGPCQPPNTEAAVSGHWPAPSGC